MEENNKSQNSLKSVLGMLALILALIIGVKLIFMGLDAAMPDLKPSASEAAGSSVSSVTGADAADNGEAGPNFCTHCGEAMREGFQWGQFCPHCGKKVE